MFGGALSPVYLGILALCLAAALAAELSRANQDDGNVVPAGATAGLPAPASPAVSDPGRTTALAAAILARPLFSPTRRPAAGPAQPAPDAPVAASLPRMTGVLVTPTVHRAIFAGPDGKSLVVAEGGRLGPYTVMSVRAGQAVVSGPDGQRTVSPAFDLKAPAPVATPVVPATPAQQQPGSGLPGLPGFRLNGGGMGVPGLSAPGLPPQTPPVMQTR